MSLRCLVLFGALVCAPPASSYNRPSQQDDLDAALLRVEESLYLGQVVADVAVLTEAGTTRLFELIGGQPTILVLAYYTCGHSCPATLHNLLRAVTDIRSPEHQIVVLSFDRKDTLETLRHAKSTLRHVPATWTFGLLSQDDSASLTGSVGFKFFFSERDQIFVHPTVLVFLSPEGEVMRYLYGTEPRPRDIELALIESRNRAPHPNELVDMLKLICFHFDASRSRYVLDPALIFGSIGIGILGVTGLVSLAYKGTPKGEQ